MTVFGIIALGLCLLSTGGIWLYMQKQAYALDQSSTQSQLNHNTRRGFMLLWLSSLIVSAVFIKQQITLNSGLDFGFYNTIAISSCFISALAFTLSIFRPTYYLGFIILPTSALCIALSMGFNQSKILTTAPSLGIQAHILFSIIAFSLLCLAAVQAILNYIQEAKLRHYNSSSLLRALPSRQENDASMFQLIILGVLMLTLALASGFIFLDNLFAQHLLHKTILSCLAWLLFVVLLFGRNQFGWRGRTATHWTLLGFSFLIIAYFGSKFVLELILQRV